MSQSLSAGGFRQCQSSGCLHRAQYVPKLCVPPQGVSPEAGMNISVVCAIPLCEDHLVVCGPEQLLNRHTHAHIEGFIKRVGGVPADYTRAFILPVLIESEEYRKWERENRQGKTH